ncbi:hypothetical protein [Fischerella thermalis]|uniref:hypothetical protein n=1 Tax=Fischerella thermalis TaxID=372787 RepID=UPI0015E11B73|nr:hypothetical protein [Fischerella thermalis]
MQSFKDLEILGARGFGETHFTLRSEFNLNHASECIQLDLECDLTQITHAQLETIGSYFTETLTAMSAQPLAHYESQCLLGDRQRQMLLVEWNNTATQYPQDCCIHQHFEPIAAQHPDAIAIVFADVETRHVASLTYQQLNHRANALAHLDYISQAIWQSKVAPAVQGRVFAVRSMLALVSLPLAYLIAGPLADQVFEPLLTPTGLLAGSVGKFIGFGRGYGIALLFVVMGMLTMLAIKYI